MNLAITTILTSQGYKQWRSCGKTWISSLLRHQWEGKIAVYRNFPQLLFPVSRTDLFEKDLPLLLDSERAAQQPVAWKQIARNHQLTGAAELYRDLDYNWVVFADADCVALRNLDHLFDSDADGLVSLRDGLPDPGFFAIRAKRVGEFLDILQPSMNLTAKALGATLRKSGWRIKNFERGEVLRPGDPGVNLSHLGAAAVVHFSRLDLLTRQRLAFGFHMMAVYGDKDGLFQDILEA
ncbi:hypothetical protein HNR46_003983 [Haloferula luteola]|uniref:Nucleotide-diphospho-sugar transferase n=1 Tax=Haloferula luteola TaxID=595692 RepID=A0A840V6X1_9BACT|nr:hypothetical protein [Haloferula luteola]MBB5353722.1 hypothetical protein [Haloferula luteola]